MHRFTSVLYLVLVFSCIIMMTGCATSSPSKHYQGTALPLTRANEIDERFIPLKGEALVCIIRPGQFVAVGAPFLVDLNGSRITGMYAGGAAFIHVPEGKNQFRFYMGGAKDKIVTLDTKAGHYYFLRVKVALFRFKVWDLSEKEGWEEIKNQNNGDIFNYEKPGRVARIRAFEQFLSCYPDSSQTALVKNNIENLNKNLQDILAKDLVKFLTDFPKDKHVTGAKEILPGEMDADWPIVKAANTTDAYELFLNMYPDSKYTEQVNLEIDTLDFKYAEESDSIEGYESYLKNHKSGAYIKEAEKQLRKLKYDYAKQAADADAYHAFISMYSEGQDVEDLKSELPEISVIKKSMELGNAIMKHAPESVMLFNGKDSHLQTKRNDPTDEDLSRLKALLSEGADPNLVKVAGYLAPGETKLGGGLTLQSTGNKGKIVRAAEEGITLLEYSNVNSLKDVATLLIEYGAK